MTISRTYEGIELGKRESELIHFLQTGSPRWWEAFFVYPARRSSKLRKQGIKKRRTKAQKRGFRVQAYKAETKARNKRFIAPGLYKQLKNLRKSARLFKGINKSDSGKVSDQTIRTACTWFNRTLKGLHSKGLFLEVPFVEHRINPESGEREFFWDFKATPAGSKSAFKFGKSI